MNTLDRASRKLTKILRHQAVDYHLAVNTNGYVKLRDILALNLRELNNITIDDIRLIVDTNEKQRLELTLSPIDNELYMRAAQGHNTKMGNLIMDDETLTKLGPDYPNPYIYHGTKQAYLASIMENGLNRMNRKHIHFVENVERDRQVSGFKQTSNAIVVVNMKKCMEDGIQFYKSSNGVILTEGNGGILSPKYFV